MWLHWGRHVGGILLSFPFLILRNIVSVWQFSNFQSFSCLIFSTWLFCVSSFSWKVATLALFAVQNSPFCAMRNPGNLRMYRKCISSLWLLTLVLVHVVFVSVFVSVCAHLCTYSSFWKLWAPMCLVHMRFCKRQSEDSIQSYYYLKGSGEEAQSSSSYTVVARRQWSALLL
jgi:hypothetical protein